MTRDPSPPDPTSVPIVPPSSPRYRVGSVIGAAALFLFACVPYYFMMVDISYMGCCDPDNNGGLSQYFRNRGAYGDLELAFFALDVILLWILLGFLLIPPVMRRRRGVEKAEPWWELLGAFVLFPVSFFSTVYALGLYERYHGLASAVPILLPPLIGLYGIWARFPHARHRADVTSAVVWGAILVLTIAPIPLSFLDARTYPDREPERTAKFRRLTPDSTLRDYLAFTDRRKDWFEAVRRVKSRQTDAVMLLKEGLLKSQEKPKPTIDERLQSYNELLQFKGLSSNLWALGLEATPSLCEAFHDVLRESAANIDPISISRGSSSNTALSDVWHQLRTIKWLTGAHCDLSDTLTDIDTKLRTVPLHPPISYEITAILNTLATLPRTH